MEKRLTDSYCWVKPEDLAEALREVLAACLVWHAKDPVHRSFHVDGNEVDRYLREGEVPVQATVFDRSQVGKIALAYVRCPEDFENLKWR